VPVRARPKSKEEESDREVDVNALINKGGTASANETEKKAATPVLIRIPAELLDRVDQALSGRPFKIPRNTWVLEAIIEKLEKEEP